MAGSLKLSFIIEAIDRATAPVRRLNERIAKITEPLTKVRASFNSLIQEAHLPRMATLAAAVSERFDGVTRSLRGMAGAALIVAGAGAAMWMPLKHVIDGGSKVHDTASTLGVAAKDFQRIAYALTLDGGSAQDAATSLRFLQTNAVEALSGSKEMALWFRRAGISAEFLGKNLNDPITLSHALADGLAVLPTAAQRLKVLETLMGRGGPRLAQTFGRGAAELRRLGDEAEALGAVMDERTVGAMDDAGDSITRMERAIGGMFNAITASALPAIERIVANVTSWTTANRALVASRVAEFVERLVERLPEIAATTARVIAGLGALIGFIDRVVQLFGGFENVLAAVATLIVGKFIVAVALLLKSIGALTVATGTFGTVLALTPIGWFIGIVAAIAALAAVVVSNWQPISEFFIELWASVRTAFSGAVDWISGRMSAVAAMVKSAFGGALDWISGRVAAFAALAAAVVSAWQPIGEFFAGLWDGVRSAFGAAIDWISGRITAITEFVEGAIARLDQLTPAWVKRFTLPGAVLSVVADAVRTPAAAASAVAPALDAPSALPAIAARGADRADVGGVIRIEFDDRGRPRVASMKNNNADVDFQVDNGLMMGAP